MKKILMLVTALFAIQSAVALAEHKPDHKGPDKDHQISVGNENAAKSGSTSDMKTVKEKENSGKDEEHRQAKEPEASGKAVTGDAEEHEGQKAKKDKKEKKEKKVKKQMKDKQ